MAHIMHMMYCSNLCSLSLDSSNATTHLYFITACPCLQTDAWR